MLRSKESTLRKIITQQFEKGINKESLFRAIREFIVRNYEIDINAGTEDGLYDLLKDIKIAGGYEEWKQMIMTKPLLISEKQKIITALLGSTPPTPEIHASKMD